MSERRESSEIRGEEEKKLRRGRILKILVLSVINPRLSFGYMNRVRET